MKLRSLLAMVYCGAAFGGSFLFMRVAAPDVPSPAFAAARVGIGALAILLVAGRPALRALASEPRQFAVLGVFMTGGPFLLFAAAEQSITAGLGSIINATTPMWTVLILAAWGRQPLTARKIVAIAVGFFGVATIVGLEGLSISPDAGVGVVLAAVAAASYGVGLTYIRRRMTHHPPLVLAFGQLAAATILLLPFAVATAGDVHPTLSAGAALLGIGILSTAIAMPTLFILNRNEGPLAASTVTFLNPIFGVLWGALFLSEVVSPTLLLGGLLVLVALSVLLDLRPAAMVRRLAGSGRSTAA